MLIWQGYEPRLACRLVPPCAERYYPTHLLSRLAGVSADQLDLESSEVPLIDTGLTAACPLPLGFLWSLLSWPT